MHTNSRKILWSLVLMCLADLILHKTTCQDQQLSLKNINQILSRVESGTLTDEDLAYIQSNIDPTLGDTHIPQDGCDDTGCLVNNVKEINFALSYGSGNTFSFTSEGLKTIYAKIATRKISTTIQLSQLFMQPEVRTFAAIVNGNDDSAGYDSCFNDDNWGGVSDTDNIKIDRSRFTSFNKQSWYRTASWMQRYCMSADVSLNNEYTCIRHEYANTNRGMAFYKIGEDHSTTMALEVQIGDEKIIVDDEMLGFQPYSLCNAEETICIDIRQGTLGDVKVQNMYVGFTYELDFSTGNMVIGNWTVYESLPSPGQISAQGLGSIQATSYEATGKYKDLNLINNAGTKNKYSTVLLWAHIGNAGDSLIGSFDHNNNEFIDKESINIKDFNYKALPKNIKFRHTRAAALSANNALDHKTSIIADLKFKNVKQTHETSMYSTGLIRKNRQLTNTYDTTLNAQDVENFRMGLMNYYATEFDTQNTLQWSNNNVNITSAIQPLLGTSQWCWVEFTSPSQNQMQALIDNGRPFDERIAKYMPLNIPKTLDGTPGGMPIVHLTFESAQEAVIPMTVTMKNYHMDFEESTGTINSWRYKSALAVVGSSGSYAVIEVDYSGQGENIAIKSSTLSFYVSTVFLENGLNTKNIAFKGVTYGSSLDLCLNGDCKSPESSTWGDPGNSDTDDPDTGDAGDDKGTSFYDLISLIFSYWGTGAVFVIGVICDTIFGIAMLISLIKMTILLCKGGAKRVGMISIICFLIHPIKCDIYQKLYFLDRLQYAIAYQDPLSVAGLDPEFSFTACGMDDLIQNHAGVPGTLTSDVIRVISNTVTDTPSRIVDAVAYQTAISNGATHYRTYPQIQLRYQGATVRYMKGPTNTASDSGVLLPCGMNNIAGISESDADVLDLIGDLSDPTTPYTFCFSIVSQATIATDGIMVYCTTKPTWGAYSMIQIDWYAYKTTNIDTQVSVLDKQLMSGTVALDALRSIAPCSKSDENVIQYALTDTGAPIGNDLYLTLRPDITLSSFCAITQLKECKTCGWVQQTRSMLKTVTSFMKPFSERYKAHKISTNFTPFALAPIKPLANELFAQALTSNGSRNAKIGGPLIALCTMGGPTAQYCYGAGVSYITNSVELPVRKLTVQTEVLDIEVTAPGQYLTYLYPTEQECKGLLAISESQGVVCATDCCVVSYNNWKSLRILKTGETLSGINGLIRRSTAPYDNVWNQLSTTYTCKASTEAQAFTCWIEVWPSSFYALVLFTPACIMLIIVIGIIRKVKGFSFLTKTLTSPYKIAKHSVNKIRTYIEPSGPNIPYNKNNNVNNGFRKLKNT